MKPQTKEPVPLPKQNAHPLQKKHSSRARSLPAVPVFQRMKSKEEDGMQKGNNTGMPDNLKTGIENLSGYSMDDVKVHYNSDKPTQLNALAYAQGTDIHIAPGQEKHLPHEAWHVVQQKQGRVKATMQMKGVGINDNEALEREADAMGAQATRMSTNDFPGYDIKNASLNNNNSNPVQRAIGFEFELEVPLYTSDDPTEFFAKKEETKFAKSHHIYDSPAFHIVQDHSAHGAEGIKTIPEVVVHHSSEDMYLDDFLTNVTAAFKFITGNSHGGILRLGNKVHAGTYQTTLTQSSSGSGQATFGVRPEGVGEIFSSKIDQFGEGFTYLYESEILKKAITSTNEIMKDAIFNNNPELSKIKGYILLISQYCASNSIRELQTGSALDKNKVPFLIRSTFGDIARATLSKTALQLLSDNSSYLTLLILKFTGAHAGTPVISPTKAEKKPVFNEKVEVWIEKTLKAIDEPLKWGSETNSEDSILVKPEEVGSAMNLPGGKRPHGGVMEERNLQKGPVNVSQWVNFAKQIWIKVCQANLKQH